MVYQDTLVFPQSIVGTLKLNLLGKFNLSRYCVSRREATESALNVILCLMRGVPSTGREERDRETGSCCGTPGRRNHIRE